MAELREAMKCWMLWDLLRACMLRKANVPRLPANLDLLWGESLTWESDAFNRTATSSEPARKHHIADTMERGLSK